MEGFRDLVTKRDLLLFAGGSVVAEDRALEGLVFVLEDGGRGGEDGGGLVELGVGEGGSSGGEVGFSGVDLGVLGNDREVV